MGTLAVNLSGAFAIGLVAGATTPGSPEATAIIGFLGGYTTYSTWMVETLRLGLVESRPQAMINLTLTLVLGIALTAAGYSLG
jgi:CrcB protein